MRARVAPDRFAREPDNALYDHGCDLVQAAAGIRRAADAPEAARAVPAVLGCIEAALAELVVACGALEQTSARRVRDEAPGHDPRRERVAERMDRGFASLERALADAELSSAAARSLAARALRAARALPPERRP